MNVIFKSVALLCIALIAACTSGDLPVVEFRTSMGNFIMEIDTLRAPVSGKNFLTLVKDGVLDSAVFYRVVRPGNQPGNKVKIEVIQGGLLADSLVAQYPAIAHEPTSVTGIRHLDGVVSMARNEPGSASTEFFICIGDQPALDFGGNRNPDGQGFAAFGKVIKGMEVVRSIQQMRDTGQYLIDHVKIHAVLIPVP
jgi:peptidyl-prolyl cis-trans isomerase A (cyclophilin A)